MATTTNNIDLITIAYYFAFIEQSQASPTTAKEDSIQQFITQASSYCEQYCNRPLVTESDIPVPTDDGGNEIVKYQPYDSDITGAATPAKTMPPEIKFACALFTRFFKMQAEHLNMAGTSTGTKTKNYQFLFPHAAERILYRYKYFQELSPTDAAR